MTAVQRQGAIALQKPRKRKEPTSSDKHFVGTHGAPGFALSTDVSEDKSDPAMAHDATRSAFPTEMVRVADSHPGEGKSVPAKAKEKGPTATRAYAPRGTDVACQGNPHPKYPVKQKTFMKASAMYEAEQGRLEEVDEA